MRFRNNKSLLNNLFGKFIACNIVKTNVRLLNKDALLQLGLQLIVVLITDFIKQIQTHKTLILLVCLQHPNGFLVRITGSELILTVSTLGHESL